MIHIVTTWDTESPCRGTFGMQACFQRDWIEATHLVMETCEQHGVPATFMVNVGEIDTWRDQTPNAEWIVREMVRRGHDVQLHLHTAWAFWWCDGREPYYDPELDVLDDGLRRFPIGAPDQPWTQRFFLRRGLDRLERITGVRPTCYRDVHYDLNDPRVFRSLWQEGIRADWTFQRGVMSNLSRGLPPKLTSADPLPNHAYWPDAIEVRRPASERGWPVLEVPNTVLPDTLDRFDFHLPAERLIAGFDAWAASVADQPTAICVFLNHQKREIFDADCRERPWRRAHPDILETMARFFEHVREQYIDVGKPVRFSQAADAVHDFIRNCPPPEGFVKFSQRI